MDALIMKFLLKLFFGTDLRVCADSKMIKGSLNNGTQDGINIYYEYDRTKGGR